MKRISFETAKLAAKKGYDKDCDSAYDIYGNIIDIDNQGLGIIPEYCCQAPYQAEICDWLRKEKGIHITADLEYLLDELDKPAPNWFMIVSCIEDGHCPRAVYESPARMGLYLTFEEAIEEGIKCVLLNLDNLDE